VKPPRHWICSSVWSFSLKPPVVPGRRTLSPRSQDSYATLASHSKDHLVLTHLPSREQYLPRPGCKRFWMPTTGGRVCSCKDAGKESFGPSGSQVGKQRRPHTGKSTAAHYIAQRLSYRYKSAGAWVAPPATGTQSRGKVSQSSRRSPWRGSHRSWKSCSAAWLLWAGRVSSASVPRGSAWWAGTRAWRPERGERLAVRDRRRWLAGWGLSPAPRQPEGRRGPGRRAKQRGHGRACCVYTHPPSSIFDYSLFGTPQLSISAHFLQGQVRSASRGASAATPPLRARAAGVLTCAPRVRPLLPAASRRSESRALPRRLYFKTLAPVLLSPSPSSRCVYGCVRALVCVCARAGLRARASFSRDSGV
jgi:hypothetical protein